MGLWDTVSRGMDLGKWIWDGMIIDSGGFEGWDDGRGDWDVGLVGFASGD